MPYSLLTPRHAAAFSVIVPTYNRAAATARAVDSALASQPCGGLEVLVVDDASRAGELAALAARYAGEARVHVLSLADNRGPSAARNLGMQSAAGMFLVFLDSDDTLAPAALALARAAFEKAPEMRFVGLDGTADNVRTGVHLARIQKTWNPGWKAARPPEWPARTLQLPVPASGNARTATLQAGNLAEAGLFGDLFFLSGLVLRREAAQAAGLFNERFRYMEDWEFTVRVCRTGPGGYLDYPGFHRQTGGADQLSRAGTRWAAVAMQQRILDTIRGATDAHDAHAHRLLGRAQAAADYDIGRCLASLRRHRQARRRFARALGRGHKPLKSLVWLLGSRLARGLTRRLSAR